MSKLEYKPVPNIINVDDINYILQENKQLKEKIERLKEQINAYENPDDMTLMFMWCDEKAKDKINKLQQKIDKAIEYIKEHSYLVQDKELNGIPLMSLRLDNCYDLLEILGGDNEN